MPTGGGMYSTLVLWALESTMSVSRIRALIPFSILAALALVWAGLASGFPPQAHANGRVAELQKKQAGPYEIALGTIPGTPIVGTLHMTMTVSDLASGAFLLDARVTATGTGPGAGHLRSALWRRRITRRRPTSTTSTPR